MTRECSSAACKANRKAHVSSKGHPQAALVCKDSTSEVETSRGPRHKHGEPLVFGVPLPCTETGPN